MLNIFTLANGRLFQEEIESLEELSRFQPIWVDLEYARWVIDPFAFLTQALQLPPMPVPDTTTENGRRLLLAHVDGDA